MSTLTFTDWLGNIENYKYNPAAMQRLSLEALKSVTDGTINVVDATNPFVFALENTTVNTVGFMQHTENINRRMYPIAAVTPQDLYLHMSDKDYIGRFALPSTVPFKLIISKQELMNALIEDVLTGISKITIPKNTVFTIADTAFSLQYPIDIRKLAHGGLQIVYDTTDVSPLLDLTTNIIEWSETTDPSGNVYISFSFDTHQFDIITKTNDVNTAAGFTTNIAIQDDFYHARVYLKKPDGTWREIATTHSEQLYRYDTPTAVIKVYDKDISVSIPSVYTLNDLVRGKIRIDIYQTKGALNLILSNYKVDDFSVKWLAIDDNDNTPYAAAINDIKTMLYYSDAQTSGGRAALSMAEFSNRVINNSIGPKSLPITTVQLQSSIVDAGYKFIKNIDTITNRVMLAAKKMPDPIDSKLVTAAAASMARTTFTLSEAVLAYGVKNNSNRITITSDAFYKNVNGITKLVSVSDYNILNSYTNAQKSEAINSNNYSYSPFHYVLDYSGNTFNVRPYYLDSPEIVSKSFVSENARTGVQVSVDSNYKISKHETGYSLIIKTKSNDVFKELPDNKVFCQISFKATGQTLNSYMLGTQLLRDSNTDERIYVFNMTSNFDINTDNQIDQSDFRFSNTSLSSVCDLLQEFNIFFIVNKTYSNVSPSVTDGLLGRFQLPDIALAITHEKIKIKFGYYLDTLWTRAKSIASAVKYKTYTTNIPAVYNEDVYRVDPVTGSSFSIAPNGSLVYDILFTKGDPILDANNNPIYKHRVGDTILDSNELPIVDPTYNNQITRYVDIFVIEGAYKFATDSSSASYRELLNKSLITWITTDISKFNMNLLDKTKIFFYPEITQGDITCLTTGNRKVTVPAQQVLNVELQVTPETYANSSLILELKRITVETISKSLLETVIAVSDIEYKLKDRYAKDVIDVKISGIGGAANYNTITILDETAKMSIKKKLVTLPNGQIILEEAISFDVIKHGTSA